MLFRSVSRARSGGVPRIAQLELGQCESQHPDFLKPVSDLLPTTQLGNDYIKFWMGKEYNFGPLVQSMLFFGALSLIVLLIAFKVRGRKR